MHNISYYTYSVIYRLIGIVYSNESVFVRLQFTENCSQTRLLSGSISSDVLRVETRPVRHSTHFDHIPASTVKIKGHAAW